MAISKETFLDQIGSELAGVPEGELSIENRGAQLSAAFKRYNHDRPGEDVVDISGDGGRYYEINTTSFPEWVEGFSHILLIEYPAPTIASDEPPKPLESDDWIDDYRDTSKRYLYLPNHSPGSGQTMRITYSFPHVFAVSGEDGTPLEVDIPSQDFEPVCKLAAGYCCQSLAVRYGQSMEPTIGADIINYAQKSDFYARRAKELVALYEEHLGIEEGVAAAGVIAELDVETIYLFHGRKTR